MHLFRVVVNWTAPSIRGVAVSVLHFDASNQSAPPVAAIDSAFARWATALPGAATITVPNTGDIIEDTTGSLVGVWSGNGGGQITGDPTKQAAAAGVGACIGWTTGGIVVGKAGKGRKLRGRTFIVPLVTAAYDNDGTLTSDYLNAMNQGADLLLGAGGFAIWHRPTTKGGSDGTSYAVLSRKVSDKVAILTSRRD